MTPIERVTPFLNVGASERLAPGGPSSDAGDVTFSPNFVLEFARMRINQVDGFLTRQLRTMQAAQRETAALNEALVTVAHYAEGFEDNPKARDELKDAFSRAAAMLPEGSPLRVRLEKMRDDPGALVNIEGDDTLAAPEMQAMQRDLDNLLKGIDRTSQQDQLMINQKMGERNEILQLCAGLLQSMNDTIKGILGRS